MKNHSITKRECEVVELISQELTSKEVADALYISYNTAETHRKNIMNKMGVKNTAGLVRRAFELGILKLNIGIPQEAYAF